MDVSGVNCQIEMKIPSGKLERCHEESKHDGIAKRSSKGRFFVREPLGQSERKEILPKNVKLLKHEGEPETTVKDCLRPPIPTKFQSLVNELKETVKKSYWNKEVGRTIYLPPHLPAGCDPTVTTFGKIKDRDEYGVAELINPREIAIEDRRVHELYRKTHNDYYPSEQFDRKYAKPFDKYSSFGNAKKAADYSGKKVARCMKWYTIDPLVVVKRPLAQFSNRAYPRLGRVHNYDQFPVDSGYSIKNCRSEHSVGAVLRETCSHPEEMYRSDYMDHFSTSYETLRATMEIRAAGIPSERTDLPSVALPHGSAKLEQENLGDQSSAMAIISPSLFTELGLSHIDFFKVRGCEEMRSIFESIGVEFPEQSFDALWQEGLRRDCTGGVCVETFRNLLGRLAENNFSNEVL